MEVVKNMAAVLGLVLTCLTIFGILSKRGSDMITKLFSKNTKAIEDTNTEQSNDIKIIQAKLDCIVATMDRMSTKIDVLEETQKQIHRDAIKEIYYKYKAAKELPLYERKALEKNYEIYTTRYNGNSYITWAYDEMKTWKTLEN